MRGSQLTLAGLAGSSGMRYSRLGSQGYKERVMYPG